MSRIRPPENFEIAALKQRQQQAAQRDPMLPGVGTPWEDRGTHGTVSAFFKTVKMSMFSPGKLAESIRRPETTSDADSFLVGCAACWGISAIIHGLIWMRGMNARTDITFDSQTYLIDCGIAAVAAGVGVWVLFRMYNAIYGKLVAQEKSQSALRPSLLYNVNAYALGPSILAIIPYAGPILAVLWIFVSLTAVGMARLHLRLAAALIDTVIPLLAMLALAVAGYFVGDFLLHQVLGNPAEPIAPVHGAGGVTAAAGA